MRYFIETICGGENASGGGCGAPLSIREVSENEFNTHTGRMHVNEFFEHTQSEVCACGYGDLPVIEEDDDTDYYHPDPNHNAYVVKLQFSPCSSCRRLF